MTWILSNLKHQYWSSQALKQLTRTMVINCRSNELYPSSWLSIEWKCILSVMLLLLLINDWRQDILGNFLIFYYQEHLFRFYVNTIIDIKSEQMLWVNKTCIAKQWRLGLNGAVLWVTLSLRERYREKKCKRVGTKKSWQRRESKFSVNNQGKQNLAEANSIHLLLFINPAIDFIQPQKLRHTVKRLILAQVFLFYPKSSFCHLFQVLFCGFDLV